MSEYCEHAADKIQQLLDRIEELEAENEKLREIEIIQEGCHTRVIIGDSTALPFTIRRKEETMPRECPDCGCTVPDGMSECPDCGRKMDLDDDDV